MKARRPSLGERRSDIYVAVDAPVERGMMMTKPTFENGYKVAPASTGSTIGGVTLAAFARRGWIRQHGKGLCQFKK
jgi:hypothetical protein